MNSGNKCIVLYCSQLRHDRYEGAVEYIISQGRVQEMQSQPATQLLLKLLSQLLTGKLDKGKFTLDLPARVYQFKKGTYYGSF